MGIQCGIVGLPNVGKSTLFNALTKASIAAENYPFCTIDPNIGVVPIADSRLDKIAEIVKPENIVPTTIQFVDIAGLVQGASKGEGLGNKFLANIRETDAICHVVRCFENDEVVHVSGQTDPLDDIEIVNTELILADLESAEKALDKISRQSKSGDKTMLAYRETMQMVVDHLDKGEPLRTLELAKEIIAELRGFQFLTAKPTLYIANVSEEGFHNNPHLDQVKAVAAKEGAEVVSVCAEIEMEMAELQDEDLQMFLDEMGLEETGLNRVTRAGYKLLGQQTYFTAGPKEVRAWTIPIGALAPQAAGVIHSDFERGFIRAEVINYDDFIQCKGEQGAREAGKLRLEGKDYVVQDGDVIHFRFNV